MLNNCSSELNKICTMSLFYDSNQGASHNFIIVFDTYYSPIDKYLDVALSIRFNYLAYKLDNLYVMNYVDQLTFIIFTQFCKKKWGKSYIIIHQKFSYKGIVYTHEKQIYSTLFAYTLK